MTKQLGYFNPFYVDSYGQVNGEYGSTEVGVFTDMSEVMDAVRDLKNWRIFVFGPKGKLIYLCDQAGPGWK